MLFASVNRRKVWGRLGMKLLVPAQPEVLLERKRNVKVGGK
jgi:hypothetical protein